MYKRSYKNSEQDLILNKLNKMLYKVPLILLTAVPILNNPSRMACLLKNYFGKFISNIISK